MDLFNYFCTFVFLFHCVLGYSRPIWKDNFLSDKKLWGFQTYGNGYQPEKHHEPSRNTPYQRHSNEAYPQHSNNLYQRNNVPYSQPNGRNEQHHLGLDYNKLLRTSSDLTTGRQTGRSHNLRNFNNGRNTRQYVNTKTQPKYNYKHDGNIPQRTQNSGVQSVKRHIHGKRYHSNPYYHNNMNEYNKNYRPKIGTNQGYDKSYDKRRNPGLSVATYGRSGDSNNLDILDSQVRDLPIKQTYPDGEQIQRVAPNAKRFQNKGDTSEYFKELTPTNTKVKPDVLIHVTHPDYGQHQWWYRQAVPVNEQNPSTSQSVSDGENPHEKQANKRPQSKGFYNEQVDETKKSYIKWEQFVWKLWKPIFFQRLLDLARSTVHVYFFPTDKNENGEIDVIEDMDHHDNQFMQRPQEDALQQLNLPFQGGTKNQKRQKRSLRMNDDMGRRVSNGIPPSVEQEIVSSPVFQKSLDDLMLALGMEQYDPYAPTDHHGYNGPPAASEVHHNPHLYGENSISQTSNDPPKTPKDRQKLIHRLWPEAIEDPDYMDSAAKEGRAPTGNNPYDQQRAARDAYASILNGYGFNGGSPRAIAQPHAHAPTNTVPNPGHPRSSAPQTVHELWPTAPREAASYQPVQSGAYPFVAVKPYADPRLQGYPGLNPARHSHGTNKYDPVPSQYQPSNDPHGIIDHAPPKPAHSHRGPPHSHHNPSHKHPPHGGRHTEPATAKEGYGSSHGGGYSNDHKGYGTQSHGGYGQSHGGSSGSSGYGHSSGGYGQSHGTSGYGDHSSGGYGMSSGYGDPHGGSSSHGGDYGKVKRWEGGEKNSGSGKKGTKGTTGRETHEYRQGKWNEKNKDNRKTKGNKVKTYSYGGHGWYKEESHGEQNGHGDKNAYSNHEDWAQEKGKHDGQETPYHEYNTKTHGYHKDLKGYHK